MSKTFKKSSRDDDFEQGTHFFKFRKSRTDLDRHKNVDKYIKARDYEHLSEEELEELEQPQR